MLETLRIKNVAIIDEIELSFSNGLNVISGETGTGKSIIIDSIDLILGGRADIGIIRKGAEEASVEALFRLTDLDWLKDRLASLGFEQERDELLIKRVVSRNGRHRIYINGELGTLSMLQGLCDGLVDLCGQHEHQSLTKSRVQLELVDRYGDLVSLREGFDLQFAHFRSLLAELSTIDSLAKENQVKLEFLNFQIQEIKSANLSPNEDEGMAREKELLQSLTQRLQILSEIRSDGSGLSLLDTARLSSDRLKELGRLDAEALKFHELMASILAQIEDLDFQLNAYGERMPADPSRLEAIHERLDVLAKLKRKYGNSVDEILAKLQALEMEAGQLEDLTERRTHLEEQITGLRQEVFQTGKELSQKRSKTAGRFATVVNQEFNDLKLTGAEFRVNVESAKSEEEMDRWVETFGADRIGFLLKSNVGEEFKPLGKVASGGELSRIMLAIRRVIADKGGIGVYLFDEIDAGIGGQTAFVVGKKLKSVSQYNQVICITHVPQIACFADHHLAVSKLTEQGRTRVQVQNLTGKGRVEEVARMLTSDKLTPASIKNAKELIDSAVV